MVGATYILGEIKILIGVALVRYLHVVKNFIQM